ncbi:MAG: GGDEF domain-containing protein [Planctomycetales bacterium]|nr:GGDEF domain-containing protein [Planctomycetales bacterium]
MTSIWFIAIIASLLSLAHLGLGFAIGLWARREPSEAGDARQMEIKRAKQLLECLRELTGAMTAEVEEHREQLATLSEQLERMEEGDDSPLTHLVIEVVSDIMRSNQQLKDRLTSAEMQLEQQTAEIESSLTRAMTDPLTGLYNRRALDDDLERRIACWQRKNTAVSVVLLDIDHFKRLNDTYGHAAGDKVLRQVANVLKATFRAMDLVTRFGGEEFAVILPETANEHAWAAAEKSIKAVRDARFTYEDHVIRVTISGGVATAMQGEFAEDLMKRADAALYASKDAGRDQGFYHNGESAVPIAENVELRETARATIESGNVANGPQAAGQSVELDAACAALRERVEHLASNDN